MNTSYSASSPNMRGAVRPERNGCAVIITITSKYSVLLCYTCIHICKCPYTYMHTNTCICIYILYIPKTCLMLVCFNGSLVSSCDTKFLASGSVIVYNFLCLNIVLN